MMVRISFFAVLISLVGVNSVLANNCAEIGKKVAIQQRGMLTRSTLSVRGGRNVCVVVVVVPAYDGQKPRRIEVTVPAD
ncbi:hypothetical protein BAnh1_03880 [Bartonella australis AUST/NH1]|uniref:Uncharacterized protein n=1 Tax=Bartonella australis (strain Aust/NH1) TaxID=1094489 RepID=M1P367_BARAA|nr:hypothetical protein [Bartonella australis]AGF74270.1 hypothetical protein BAnh1_03880 [Bartonella australis AUST/NH1]